MEEVLTKYFILISFSPYHLKKSSPKEVLRVTIWWRRSYLGLWSQVRPRWRTEQEEICPYIFFCYTLTYLLISWKYIRLLPPYILHVLRISLDAVAPASKNGILKSDFPLDGGVFERGNISERVCVWRWFSRNRDRLLSGCQQISQNPFTSICPSPLRVLLYTGWNMMVTCPASKLQVERTISV